MDQTARITEWLRKAQAAHGKLGEALAGLDATLNEQPTIGQQAKALLDLFVSSWTQKYQGQRYVVTQGGRDMQALKRAIEPLGVDEVRRRLLAYLASPDPFYGNARHPLTLFIASINKFGRDVDTREAFLISAPSDCRHRPACVSDAMHTRRRMDERRAMATPEPPL